EVAEGGFEMKLPRRTFLHLAAGAAALPAVSRIAFDQTHRPRRCAPKNTSTEIVDKLNKEVNAALDDPKMKARLANLGGTVLAGSPADFGKLIAEETEKWAKVTRAANIKPQG